MKWIVIFSLLAVFVLVSVSWIVVNGRESEALPAPSETPTATATPTKTPTPIPTPTPELTPTPTPIPKIEVEWETIGPAEPRGLWGVSIDDNEGKILHVVGGLPGETTGPLYIWKTENEGQSWQRIGLLLDPNINFRAKERILKNMGPVSTLQWEAKKDPNNPDIIWKPVLPAPLAPDDWEFQLTFNGGKSWAKLALPSFIEARGNEILTESSHFDFISSDGNLNLFLVWKTLFRGRISLPE